MIVVFGIDYFGDSNVIGAFENEQKAVEAACKIVDADDDYDFYRFVEDGNLLYSLNSTKLYMHTCPICGKEFRRRDGVFSIDCHGIHYRLMCKGCWEKIEETVGYDGELYTEFDENIEEDW